jgi:succinate-semialdehyde dehydrogenase/glutarate-semialdehyde dehydrogenase
VTTDMIVTKEETFGPVAPLYRFKNEGEAINMANDTEFGLAAYFYSREIGHLARCRGPRIRHRRHQRRHHLDRDRPLWRHEGKRHRPHLLVHWGSKYGIEEFLEVKYLCMGGIDR